jgi:hypothetical protein
MKFFPGLIRSRLLPKKKAEGTHFVSTFELFILLAFFLFLVARGMPLALDHGSVIGWMVGAIGIIGTIALVIFSIIAQLGTKPSYDNFLFGVFFFFVFLGLTVGIFIGKTEFSSYWWLLFGAIGLFTGYFLGILAGFWSQCLGWIVAIVDLICGCAVIGMIVVDVVLLFVK